MTIGTSRLHPEYGLPNRVRTYAVLYAKDYGINAAASKFHVTAQTIKRWVQNIDIN